MPVSAIEKELTSVTKVKMSAKNRQKSLKALVDDASDLEEESWEGLSAEAQAWVNAGIKASNSEKPIKDFASAKDDDESEDDTDTDTEVEGTKDNDESEPDEDGETEGEDEAGDDSEKDEDMGEDEDEDTSKKRKVVKKAAAEKKSARKESLKKAAKKTAAPEKKVAKRAVEKPEKKKAAKPAANGMALDKKGIKYRIKLAMMKKPNIGVEELCEKLGEGTPMTVSQIRAEFRHSLRFLKMEGHLETDIQ